MVLFNIGNGAGSSQISYVRGSSGTEGGLAFDTATGGVLSEAVRIQPTGNVGIGTATPAVQLHTHTQNAGDPDTTGSGTTGVSARFQNSSVNLDIVTYVSGACWIQPRLTGNNASNFDLVLNPNGGIVSGTWSNFTTGNGNSKMMKLTQAQYDGITPDADTMYFIVG
jgi:hypothetical protein